VFTSDAAKGVDGNYRVGDTGCSAKVRAVSSSECPSKTWDAPLRCRSSSSTQRKGSEPQHSKSFGEEVYPGSRAIGAKSQKIRYFETGKDNAKRVEWLPGLRSALLHCLFEDFCTSNPC